MSEKRKTLTLKLKKVANKVVDIVNELGEQPMQEQDLIRGIMPKEKIKAEPKPEKENEKENENETKKDGIEKDIYPKTFNDINTNGINVENKESQMIITFPNRKDINYLFSESVTGMKSTVLGWNKANIENKIFEKENLQEKTVSFNTNDFNLDNFNKLSKSIDKAIEINKEYILEKDDAMDYFKMAANGKEVRVLGVPYKAQDKMVNGELTGDKEFKPSYFNGEIVKAGKHLLAALEGSTDDKIYVRLIETTKLPLDVQDYSDKESAVKRHLGIKNENIVKQTINDKEQISIKDVKRHIAFGPDWNISKINDYTPKQDKEKIVQKRNVQTM